MIFIRVQLKFKKHLGICKTLIPEKVANKKT